MKFMQVTGMMVALVLFLIRVPDTVCMKWRKLFVLQVLDFLEGIAHGEMTEYCQTDFKSPFREYWCPRNRVLQPIYF